MKLFRRPASVVATLLLALTGVLTGAQQAAAAAPAYVALGDSYSSGTGAGDYGDSGDCKRSANSYPSLWAAANSPSSFSFTACSGATTTTVISGQLSPLSAATGLISVSAGGNDVGFADVMTTCILENEESCLSAVATARSQMSSLLPGRLNTLYATIKSRAPNARVVVMGYPRLYMLNGTCIVGLRESERAALNAASDQLNSVISARAAAYGFTFGDVRTTFTGHEICSGAEWLHSLTVPVGNSYHPNKNGQALGYLPVFRARAA
ncbi:SGNH/GDSL hydrolase family protein [Streptomyces sp. PSKA54]|uniref:SGNH/GDSL hydrolase family protein n=1 Tax=Streptomyces himalayensis subsp. aureolus TaxID=2758039 RepID=A0A7W2D1K3_9ACTN|nr:SGNH/GDSL hydrolase family protein [Streptomyces himalayensis]MBA4862780.1 SGNH/GDSL hydrolase family protein [Streptomyces himalayensis subsp. aureolus]